MQRNAEFPKQPLFRRSLTHIPLFLLHSPCAASLSSILLLTYHQFETFPMQIHDLDRRIFAEVFAELGNVYVHAACIEIGIVAPDGFQCEAAADRLVQILTKKPEQLRFLARQARGVLAYG